MTPARPAVEAPVVQMTEIQLAGFSQDLYYALEGWVEFGVQVLQDFFFWNPDFAAQIGNLYTTLQPIVERVVILVTNLIDGPADILGTLTSLASGIFGLPALSAASTVAGPVSAAPATASTGDGPRTAAATLSELDETAPAELAPTEAAPADVPVTEAAPAEPAPAEAAPEVVAEVAPVEVSVPAAVSRTERGRAARGARQAVPAAAATQAAVEAQGVDEAGAAPSKAEVSGVARASRGASDRAAGQTRSAAKGAR
jgi:hypothetical protein